MHAVLRRLRHISGSTVVAMAVLATVFAIPAIVAASPPGQPISPFEQEVVDLVNAERAKVGAQPLIVNYSLMEAAWFHNEHMVSIGRICHSGCGDGDPGRRIAATGYQAATWGENVAYGFPSPTAVMNAWMHSSGHRANILSKNYTDIGVAYSPANYWTQVFGRPRSDYATVTPPSGGPDIPGPTATPCVMARDFDADHVVTMADVGIIRDAFMAIPGDPRWDPMFDTVPNGVVDIYDVFDVILAVGTEGCR